MTTKRKKKTAKKKRTTRKKAPTAAAKTSNDDVVAAHFSDVAADQTKFKVPRAALEFEIGPVALADEQPADDADGDVEVTERRFSGVANSGAILNHGWWGKFAIDLEGLEIGRQDKPVLRDHDARAIVGFTDKIEVTKEGIESEGLVFSDTEAGAEVMKLAARNFPWQMSVYVPPTKILRLAEGEEAEVNGQTMEGPGAIFRESRLREVTFTALGADEATGAALLSAGSAEEVELEIEQTQEKNAMTKRTTDRVASADSEVEVGNVAQLRDEYPDLCAELAEAAKADERKRCAALDELSEGVDPELVQKCKDDGTSVEEATRLFLKDVQATKTIHGKKLKTRLAEGVGADEDVEFEDDDAPPKGKSKLSDEDKWKKEFAESEKLQNQFQEERFYLAYMRNKHRTRNLASREKED